MRGKIDLGDGHLYKHNKLISTVREYFGNTREPSALTLGGDKIHFLTDAEDVAAVCKNTSTFIFDRVVYELSIQFGVSPEGTAKIHGKPASSEDDVVCTKLQIKNPQLKTLQHLNSEFFKKQLHPGDQYDTMLAKYTKSFDCSLHPKNLRSALPELSGCDRTVKSLLHWTRDTFMASSLEILFGNRIQELDPNVIKKFLIFDEDNWKVWYRWPVPGRTYKAKNSVIETLRAYLNLQHEQRPGATFLIKIIEDSQRALGLSDQDIATNLMIIFWGYVTDSL